MLRQISRGAVGGYLKAARMPLDAAVRVTRGGNGRTSSATLAIDRVEAAARYLAGRALGDAELREDARRRSAAARERERALNLRGAADARAERADEHLDEGRERAR